MEQYAFFPSISLAELIDRLLKRKRSDDLSEGLPGKRLCIRDEEVVGSSDERMDKERRYIESLRDLLVYLSTISGKEGVAWATISVNELKWKIVRRLEGIAKSEERALRKQQRLERRGVSGGSGDA